MNDAFTTVSYIREVPLYRHHINMDSLPAEMLYEVGKLLQIVDLLSLMAVSRWIEEVLLPLLMEAVMRPNTECWSCMNSDIVNGDVVVIHICTCDMATDLYDLKKVC